MPQFSFERWRVWRPDPQTVAISSGLEKTSWFGQNGYVKHTLK